jgi:hypothetical protein
VSDETSDEPEASHTGDDVERGTLLRTLLRALLCALLRALQFSCLLCGCRLISRGVWGGLVDKVECSPIGGFFTHWWGYFVTEEFSCSMFSAGTFCYRSRLGCGATRG